MELLQKYDQLFLSPHLDDVALSCGGQIAMMVRKRKRVLVATVATADPLERQVSPLAEIAHKMWRLPCAPMAHRRAEDAAAWSKLGADFVHLDFYDGLYRCSGTVPHANFYCRQEDLFGPLHPEDVGLMLPHLVALLCHLPFANQVVAPLAVGNHVDHRLTRLAAEQAFPGKLLFFEDFPYALSPEKLCEAMRPNLGMSPQITLLSRAAEMKKLQGIREYESQTPLLFESRRTMRLLIHKYHSKVGGERYWIAHSHRVGLNRPPWPPQNGSEPS